MLEWLVILLLVRIDNINQGERVISERKCSLALCTIVNRLLLSSSLISSGGCFIILVALKYGNIDLLQKAMMLPA